MSLEDDVIRFFRNINSNIQTNKYTREDLRKTSNLLRIESAYMKYMIKTKLGLGGDNILIDSHRRIITDYIKILKTNISKTDIDKNPELYYLIIAYLRIIEKDNKLLLNATTRFISVYLSSIKQKKILNSSLNVITLSMEISDNIKSAFSRDVYVNQGEFNYIKKIIGIVLENYEELQSSRENSSDNDSCDGFITDDNQKIDDNNKSSSSSNSSSSPSISSRCCENDYCNENCNCNELVEFYDITNNNTTNGNITEI